MSAATQNRFDGCPPPPRFITHTEIENTRNLERLSRFEDLARQDDDDALLFKRMNAYACRMSRLWNRNRGPSAAERMRYLKWHAEYLRIRDILTNRHIGLVYGLLRKCRFTAVEHDELRSEGLMALIRSVDSFSPWRGFRFSTYACNAILRAFSQVAMKQSKRQHVWMTTVEYDGMESSNWAEQRDRERIELLSERLRKAITDGRAELSDTERLILAERFLTPADTKKSSLKQLGEKLNLSKERVRQIQQASLEKLRAALLEDPVLRLREWGADSMTG